MKRFTLPPHLLALVMLAALMPGISSLEAQTNWPATIERLKREVRSKPRDRSLKNQLAIAYNNYAMSLGNQGNWEEATRQMEEAYRLDRQDASLKENLAQVYLNYANQLYQEPTRERSYQSYRHQESKKLVEKALALNSRLASGYVLLGDIEYDNQQLGRAKLAWQRAKRLDPGMRGLTSRLDRLEQEAAVESNMTSVGDVYFTLQYDDSVKQSSGYDIRQVLREARQKVGRDFKYRPNHRIVVLLYSQDAFREVRSRAPEWAAGIFDGKIRVPMPENQQDLGNVKKTIVHEYTHAIVQELSGGRIPHWFNEGLAEFQEAKYAGGKGSTSLLKSALENDRLPAWNQIEGLFRGRDTRLVTLGYSQSHSVVAYLAQRYGFRHMPQLLKQVAQGVTFEEALKKEFNSPAERLERDWKRWLPRFF
jgi:tetratricopeptide (TPR) repeat protein